VDKAVETEVVKKLEEILKLLGMSQCVLLFSKEGNDFNAGIFTYNVNPVTMLGYAKYLEHAGNSQMAQKFLNDSIQRALHDAKNEAMAKAQERDPVTKHTVIH